VLYCAYGIVSGFGGGIGYVTPITTLIRWFRDRRGLVTGLAVMGYGFGSFIMGKVGPRAIISFGIDTTFFIWGALSLVLVLTSVLLFREPPEGWMPAGWSAKKAGGGATEAPSFTFAEAAGTIQFWALWVLVFLIVTAGLGLISQLSPLAQDVLLSKATGPVSKGDLDAAPSSS
jgi:OFA family oxalate/formate antiporter-like MFS transporter